MKKKGIIDWLSVSRAKAPKKFLLFEIALMNIVFFILSATVISKLAPSSVSRNDFWTSVFYTISMVLDAGCITYVIEDVGQVGVAVILACLLIVFVGMIIFTGAVIGYITTYISDSIDNTNAGKWKLRVAGHTIILNWNSRATEIVNDMLYSEHMEAVVVLTNKNNKETIENEIKERLMNTIETENKHIREKMRHMSLFAGLNYWNKNRLRWNHIAVIVREGDTFSQKMLSDVSIKRAKAVIILGNDIQNSVCKFNQQEMMERNKKGNSNLVKTLIQVADMTGAEDSADDQQLAIEVEDRWTMSLVDQIIEHKKRKGKCNIVPISTDKILGQILSQFSIMPELNMVYEELLSNKGAAFYSQTIPAVVDSQEYNQEYLKKHDCAVPLTCLEDENGVEYFFMAGSERDVLCSSPVEQDDYSVKLNTDFWMTRRNVIILGHNSKCNALMDGFNSFRNEWNFRDEKRIRENGGAEILNITVIDDEDSLKRLDYYQEYPYVNNVVVADIYDRSVILEAIERIVSDNSGDTSILILSDDTASTEDIDSAALTYLIYVQNIVLRRLGTNTGDIDVIVEILNPKNHDIVQSYSIDNIVISNRYISKMATQISAKKAIYNFYRDILTYDEANAKNYESKELYVKKVREFFAETPAPCTAAQFVRAVYNAGPIDNKSMVLGYVKEGNKLVIFSGELSKIPVALGPDDKIILYSNH